MQTNITSVYDILLRNLQISNRKTFMHRFIYAGEHKGEKETEELFSNLINATNEAYCQEKITGLLVLYPNYFFHIIDCDETAFMFHLEHLFFNNTLFGEMRLLIAYHHINQRLFDEWAIRKAKPPILLEKIDPASDFEELKRHLGICITKIYNLALYLRQPDPENEEYTRIGEILSYMNQFLPEYTLLNFLVHQKMLYCMRDMLEVQSLVMDSSYMLGDIWPVRNDFVPFNVFDTEINPIPHLK